MAAVVVCCYSPSLSAGDGRSEAGMAISIPDTSATVEVSLKPTPPERTKIGFERNIRPVGQVPRPARLQPTA